MARTLARRPDPIAAINITPLIDVMLVLLIMVVMTLPAPNHKVPIDLPGQGIPKHAVAPPHRLEILASGGLLWDGKPVSDGDLRPRLQPIAIAGDALELRTDAETRYDRFDQVLAMLKQAQVTKLGFVGNEGMRF